LAETTGVLSVSYGLGAAKIATAVEMLLSHEQLSLETPGIVRAALERFRQKPALGFSDCLILELARAAGHLPLGTFDRELGKLDGAERL
jgi:predicted nucleic-acid-binding protein